MDAMVGKVLLIGTSVLMVATDASRPFHNDVHELFASADLRGFHLAVGGQVVRGCLAVHRRFVAFHGSGLGVTDEESSR